LAPISSPVYSFPPEDRECTDGIRKASTLTRNPIEPRFTHPPSEFEISCFCDQSSETNLWSKDLVDRAETHRFYVALSFADDQRA
jgi:hypothetical protein